MNREKRALNKTGKQGSQYIYISLQNKQNAMSTIAQLIQVSKR